ncbi:hypothetical protein [uncultured Winogradskyella sp.]|uniref:hypothetical protein n=1 Tax=uncultured Winogradskyella sp. TaxID=395353 RepID=UPI00262CEA05|nr:hypothetical protein [uncultured Winogradskyella sp.]
MDYSLFFAKFWGWYLLIFFFILSVNPKRIKQVFNDLYDQKFLILTAFIAIVVGLLNIIFHNIWELSYKLIITLIGWTALFMGLALFSFPKRTISFLAVANIKLVQLIYTMLLLLGIYLLNTAYSIVLF